MTAIFIEAETDSPRLRGAAPPRPLCAIEAEALFLRLVVLLAASLLCAPARAGEWPTYLHDARRSGTTTEKLALPLVPSWTYTPRHPPAPAWPPPAKADFWHHKRDLEQRVTYDRAYHTAVAQGLVFFGSSADDKIYALDAATGREAWSFFTGGPVRLAPYVEGGRVYAGSDDGRVYCLEAATGRLLWSRKPKTPDRFVIGNGRMISAAPVRTGVVVEGGTVHFCAGIFPLEGVLLTALNARTGRIIYEKAADISPQGYMLASRDRIYVPTGRTSPVVFDREKGDLLGAFKGSSGAYALVAEDLLVYGPGDTGTLGVASAASRDLVATFPGLHMIVGGDIAYLHAKSGITALDRRRYLELLGERKKMKARTREIEKELKGLGKKASGPKGSRLAGERKKLAEKLAACSKAMAACTLWERACNYPYSFILAGNLLFAGGDGRIAAFRVDDGEEAWRAEVPGRAEGLAVAEGRLFASTSAGPILCFESGRGKKEKTAAVPAAAPPPFAEDALTPLYGRAARWIVDHAGVRKGYCLVLRCGEGRLAYEIARLTDMKVVALEDDAKKVAAARRALDRAGVYGTRVTVHQGTLANLPYPDFFANLVVCDGTLVNGKVPEPAREMYRLLRPEGGVAVAGAFYPAGGGASLAARLKKWIRAAAPGEGRLIEDEGGLFALIRRGPLPGAGEWTHTYADPGNTACSKDSRVKGKLALQWFGRPGPRLMIDRHHRNVPPLYKDGRIFIPGDEIVIAADAYNGTRLWDVTVPGSRRLGVFLDTSNMAVDGDFLYVVHGDRCDRFRVGDGAPAPSFVMPQAIAGEKDDWSYVARGGNLLFGTGRIPGASYTRTSYAADAALWYDNMSVVTSRFVFALDAKTGGTAWTYRSGIIINTTLAMGGGRVYLVESHSPAALKNTLGRMPQRTFLEGDANFLTALDAKTGKVLYRKKIDLSDCRLISYLQYAGGMLLLSGCHYVDEKLWYFFRGIDGETGKVKWKAAHNSGYDPGGGHGEQNRHPTIVGGVAYTYPFAYRLKDGKRVEGYVFSRAGHGCGGVSGSLYSLFWRGGNPAMRDLRPGGGISKINHVNRPGCWINIIPAGGLVIMPEASSGCTCGFPLQTSMAYRPLEDGF